MSALVGVIMGSKSDWSTLSHTADMLEKLGIPHEVTVVSAHRTPDLLFQYAEQAEARGLRLIIAGAGGAAHLPGMCAAKTHLPVLGVRLGQQRGDVADRRVEQLVLDLGVHLELAEQVVAQPPSPPPPEEARRRST